MQFDSQDQKDFILGALAKTPITTTLGNLLNDAMVVGSILQQAQAGEVVLPKVKATAKKTAKAADVLTPPAGTAPSDTASPRARPSRARPNPAAGAAAATLAGANNASA